MRSILSRALSPCTKVICDPLSTEEDRKGSIGSAVHGPGAQPDFEGVAVASADDIGLGTRLYVDAQIQVVTVCTQIWGECF
jgi:hypothetical protein